MQFFLIMGAWFPPLLPRSQNNQPDDCGHITLQKKMNDSSLWPWPCTQQSSPKTFLPRRMGKSFHGADGSRSLSFTAPSQKGSHNCRALRSGSKQLIVITVLATTAAVRSSSTDFLSSSGTASNETEAVPRLFRWKTIRSERPKSGNYNQLFDS